MTGQRGQRDQEIEATLVVVGGGLAGVACAIAAANEGCQTLLIHDRAVLGGNASSEIRVPPAGSAHAHAWAAETGWLHELLLETLHNSATGQLDEGALDLALLTAGRSTPRLRCLRNTSVRSVHRVGDRIVGLTAVQLGTELTWHVRGEHFVDATGDGVVAHDAGADVANGRESRDTYGERLAPLNADTATLGSTLYLRAKRSDRPVSFTRPSWAADYSKRPPFGKDRRSEPFGDAEYSGFWWLEIAEPYHPISDYQEIIDELQSHALGIWDYLKNHSPQKEEAEQYALAWVGHLAGKRESRRVLGEVIITEDHCQNDPDWSDAIGYAGWWIDLHSRAGILDRTWPAERENVDPHYAAYARVSPFSVPLRAYIARSIDNLWMAGRCLSATHVAHGALRVMLTLASHGQAVGVAAATALSGGLDPKSLARDDAEVRRLQQRLLAQDVRLLGIRNDMAEDDARNALVSATSAALLTLDDDVHDWIALGDGRAQVLPITGRLSTLSLTLRGHGRAVVSVSRLSRIWDRRSGDILWQGTIDVDGEGDYPVRTDLDLPAGAYRVAVTGAPDVEWASCRDAPVGTVTQFRVHSGGGPTDLPGFTPDEIDLPPVDLWRQSRRVHHWLRCEPVQRPYGPENVISGCAWPEDLPHCWVSDSDDTQPPSLTLSWAAPTAIGEIDVRFDSGLDLKVTDRGTAVAPTLVTSWRVQVLCGERWRTIHQEQGNCHRQRRIVLSATTTTTGLRIIVDSTGGDPSARIFEVRAYAPR